MNVRLLSLFITLLGYQVYGQLTGGRENSQKSPSVSEVGKLSGGIYAGDVNTFTGGHQSSIPLGSVSTLSGLGYTLELNRGSSFSFGGNEPKVKGLLYGDGWELNIPVITVTTDIFHRFGNGAECQDNGGIDTLNTNLKTSDYDRSWEGDVFWLEPYVSIPGVGSGRAVFKYVDAVDANCAVFVLNKFSTSVELRFYGTSWVVKVGDGSVYVFEGTIHQFSAPSNKRQYHYDNTTHTYSTSDEGTAVVLENNYPVKEDAVNVIEPKIYYNSWYCSRIFHPNYQGQNIIFEYERYGEVNFFKEFQQENYQDVHRSVFVDRSASYLPDYTTYRDIVLQRVIGSSVDGNTDIIELEYGIDGSLSSSYLLTPGVSGAVATDPMYCSQVVKRYDGTSTNSYSGWHRYPHANRNKTINPEDINQTNPYINPSSNYTREGVTSVASGIPFDHGFLESPRISDAAALVAGDLYEIRTRVTRPDGEDLKNGNGTLDIAVVTNGTAGTSYSEPSSPILHTNYNVTRGEQLFSTFNMALKWQMGWGDEVLQTSNLFVMPNLPENFQGFNIQVGPGNSDIDYNYYSNTDLYYTVTTPVQSTNRPNALWAYPQLKGQTLLKSAGTIARNFGTGHPWGSMLPVYNHRALVGASGTGSPASFEELYKGTWSMASTEITTYGDHHNPTKFNNTVELEEVELIRHGRTGYMLMGVKQYRMEGEYGGPVTTGKKLVSQKRIKYEMKYVNTRRNRNYTDGNTIVMELNNSEVILLKSVHEVPLEGNLYASNFGLTDPTVVLTTDFEYTNLLPGSGTYSQTTPYVGLVYYALTKFTDNLGGITEIEYYPINASPTRTYSTTNFNWNCGTYVPASYGVEKSFTMNLAVKYITKRAADYDALAQAFVPSTRQWEYVYDLTKSTFSFKRLELPSDHFRSHYANTHERGYAKVTVYEPALETGERNYTVHEFYGNVNYPFTLPGTTTVTDYLYYGKPKSVKTYDHQGKIHQEKLYNYSYTLAFEDGYGRPNFYRDQVNRYYQPVTDNYEYRDYYTGDEPTATVGSTVQTGDAAKWTIAGSVRGIGGSEGYSMEHPKYLPFYFHDELRASFTISDVNGDPLTSGYMNPAYAFNSYFIKLVSEIDRTYEDGLTTQLTANPVIVTDPVRNKEPKPRNPFGGGIVKPSTAFDSLYLDMITNAPAETAYNALMQAGNSLSQQVLGAMGMSDSFTFDQKVNIMANQGGLTNGIWLGILDIATYLTPLQLKRLVLSQPYFTDTIQKRAIEVRLTDKSILTAILTRNPYLSDDVVGYMTDAPSDWIGESYEHALAVQPLFTDSLLKVVVEDDKLKWQMLTTVLKHQQPLDDHYRILMDRTDLTTASIADLFLTGDGIPSDTTLYYFFTERTTDSATVQAIIDHVARPLPAYLKGHLEITFPLVVFHDWVNWPGYNPLDAYCGNPVSGSRIYIETKTEYEYYEADYRGHAQGKAYELLMGMISSVDEPSTFPKNVPTYSADSIYIPALRLKYEPSWQVFAKKVTSPHLPGASQREEYFYLYDLQNRYGRHWANYDVTNYEKYQMEEFWDTGIPLDTVVYNKDLNRAFHHDFGELPDIPQYDGMVKSRDYNMRGIPFQKTSFSRTAADPAVVSRSEYYHYDARWNFSDLTSATIARTFVGDTCIIPPGEPSCACIYENHIFGDYEMGLMQQRYTPENYCYYHIGGDGTGWQYAYWVCPREVDAYACYPGQITSEICSEPEGPESPENPGGPIAIYPIGEVLSKTLQLRSTYVQVDTVDYLSDHDFLDNKWDRKNRYIAEFGMDSIGPDPIDGFQGKNYRMILPFTSLLSQKILERNRHTQVALQEDATGLQTKYHYQKPTYYHYRNTRCESDGYSTVLYRNTGLPFRVTVGYGRADSMGTDYTYTTAAQVASTTNPFGLEMRYTFDGFNRLIQVREFSSTDTLVLSEAAYHLWDRGSASDDFMERAAQNYVEKRVFNSSDPADYSFTREYADPLGRAAGAVTAYNEEGRTQFIYTGSVWYDKWDRGFRQFKNVAPTSVGISSGQTHAIPALQWDYTTSFTESELERTPKNRAKKAADFGVSITSPIDKTVRKRYAIANNVYTSCELELSGDELRAVMTDGNTAGFRFFRVQTLDQDDNKSVVYTNAFGQTIGTISYLSASDKVITLFVYDNMGNVKQVINPVKLENTYEYNLLGQLYRETTPEAGEKKYMYNKRGQVSLMLDQELWSRMDGSDRAPLYREYRYDAYGRPTDVGFIEGPVYRESTQYGPLHYKTEFYGVYEHPDKYPLCAVPHYNPNPQECAYFDYVFSHSSTQDWLLRYQVTELEGGLNPGAYAPDDIRDVVFSTPEYHTLVQREKKYVYQDNTGLLEHTESYDLSGYEIQRVLYGYNYRGKINHQKTYFNETPQTITDITLVESAVIEYPAYSTQGLPLHQSVDVDNDGNLELQYFYQYDALSRLRAIKVLDNNGISDNATTIVQYAYDNVEGVLNTRIHEVSKPLTQTTYSYDERVRLKSIITKNATVDSSSPELMKHQYHYDMQVPTYENPIQTHVPGFGFNHNGNINGIISSYDFEGVYGSPPSQFAHPTVYGYKYDRLNRLVHADGLVGDFVVAAIAVGQQAAGTLIGNEYYNYDKIGNIKYMDRTIRHSDPLDNTVVSKAEGWGYYYNSQNRLTQVMGNPGTASRGYTYDKNGNLLTDSYREITEMQYGRTAYPYYLEADNNKIAYLYSVDDQRMYKKVESPTETTTKFYLQDAMGKTVALRRKVGSATATWEYYVNASEREARIKNVTHNGIIAPQEIEFYLYDHLGNTRVVYEHTYAGGGLAELVINYAADYFSYGKILREYVNTNTGDPEKFLTTQHERDQETGLDYRGARFYDSDIARFLSLDPLASKFPSWSTYNYVMGNPIALIDPNGKAPKPPMHYNYLTTVGLQIFDFAKSKGASSQGALMVLSQAVLESGWDGSSSNYNLFSIMAGKGEPSNGQTSHGRVKDYTNIGGYEASMQDYHSKLASKWPRALDLIKQENITATGIDRAFNTGSYQQSDAERNKTGEYSYCKDCDYGNDIRNQMNSVKKHMVNALNYGIKAADEFISTSNFILNGNVANLDYKTEIKVQQHETREQKAKYEGYLKEFNK